MAAIGVCTTLIPFGASLDPAQGADLKLCHIDVSGLRPGQFVVRPSGRSRWRWPEALLVIRDETGTFHVFSLPQVNGAAMLPDIHWWRQGGLCKDFGPSLEAGVVKSDTVISCHDPGTTEWQVTEYRWSITGQNLGHQTDDLPSPKYVVEEPYLVIGKAE